MRLATAGATTIATLILCFLAALAEGFDIQSMGVAAPHLAPALGLTRAQLGPVFSASLIGLLLGAVIVGRLSDRFGRKWTLILSLVSYGVFSGASDVAAVRFNAHRTDLIHADSPDETGTGRPLERSGRLY